MACPADCGGGRYDVQGPGLAAPELVFPDGVQTPAWGRSGEMSDASAFSIDTAGASRII